VGAGVELDGAAVEDERTADAGEHTTAAGPAIASPAADPAALRRLARALVHCSNAELRGDGTDRGDPTEVALLAAARDLGVELDPAVRERDRIAENRFDARLKLMSTLDRHAGRVELHVKGAPESVLGRCSAVLTRDGERALDEAWTARLHAIVDRYAADGLRVLAVAERAVAPDAADETRDLMERDLVLLGAVALIDPPRPEVADAVADCHTAGIQIIMVTGDHPVTGEAIARRVGIVRGEHPEVITQQRLDAMPERQLDDLLRVAPEIVFARSTPEAKLRIADALRATGHVIAMTGDGVNDAPALQRADIGVAMGRGGTDVAREAATIVLTDDNFATIVAAVAAGRRIFANIRKFIFYIFAHLTPEIVPFMVFALSGGSVPLPLTVLQLLTFDVGTEVLPALALGREPAEPGLMHRPPRPRAAGIVDRAMLLRAWVFVGLIAATLSMAAFFYVLLDAGWSAGAAVGPGTALHHGYLQATTMTFVSMVFCQVGTALAARTDRMSLRSVGMFSNPMLLWGIAFELALTAAIVYLPPLQSLLHTAALPLHYVLLVLPFPLIVWGADELRRWRERSH
jgi:magnesium-transporting ATPase (P-type)